MTLQEPLHSVLFYFFFRKRVAEEREMHHSPDQLCSGLPEATSVHLAEPGRRVWTWWPLCSPRKELARGKKREVEPPQLHPVPSQNRRQGLRASQDLGENQVCRNLCWARNCRVNWLRRLSPALSASPMILTAL